MARKSYELKKENILKVVFLVGTFVFIILGILSFDKEPDFVFDKFLGAAFFLFFYFFHKKLDTSIPVLVYGFFVFLLHHLKLYGNVYFGLQFDMIFHFLGATALAMVVYQYLKKCDGCKSMLKIAVLTVLIVAGAGTLIEITEYFGYSNLKPGEGILHFGAGDEGEWNDAVWDMICNLLGAIVSVIFMTLVYLDTEWKRFIERYI